MILFHRSLRKSEGGRPLGFPLLALRGVEPEKSCGVVIENVAFLLGAQVVGILDHAD